MKKNIIIICLLTLIILTNNQAKSQLADGTTAPNFTLVDINGTSYNLYNYLNSGKTVVLDFFATWCGPCWSYHNSGALDAFYAQHGPSGDNTAMVFFIESDQSTLSCIQGSGNNCGNTGGATQGNWINGTPYPILPTYSPNGPSVSIAYNVSTVPTCYMICPNDKKTKLVNQYTTAQLNAAMAACPVTLDAGIYNITTPNGTVCNTTISPVVTIINRGITTLTSCTINYKVDANTVQTVSWAGSLSTGYGAIVTLPDITTTIGAHTFTAYTSNPNNGTDGNAANNQSVSNFVVNTVGASLPMAEGFESSTSIPVGWSLYNPDYDAAWQISTTVAHTGTHSIGFNNCDGDGTTDMTGRKDRFYTTTYNFSNITSPVMSFDVAYAHLIDGGITYGDTLFIYSSVNCGNSWTQIYKKGGSALASAPAWTSIASCWSPSSSQWRTDNITLNSLVGQSNVMFRFENHSDWAGWIYLDNISITGLVDIASYNTNEGFVIYPNPAASSFTIEATSIAEKVNYSVYNIVGERIKSGDINRNGSNFHGKIQTTDMPGGVYLIKVTDGNSSLIQKLIIQ